MKAPGWSRPLLGWRQRTSASTFSSSPVCGRDDRLVVHLELAALDGHAQLCHQHELVGVVAIGFDVVAHHAGTALLRRVHGDVRSANELADVEAVVGRERDADARVDRYRDAAN